MKIFGLVSVTALFLLLGNSVPGHAQDQEEPTKPSQQEEQKPAAPARPQETRPPQREMPRPEGKQERAAPQEQKQEHEQSKHAQDDARKAQEQDRRAQEKQGRRMQEDQSRRSQQEQHERVQHHEESGRAPVATGRRGGRVPEEDFRAHFGRQHTFVINRPVIIDNRPRFQYSGYWFEIVGRLA